MKKQIFILILFILNGFFLSAQISESEQSMSQGVKNAFVLEMPNADEKVVEKTWKKYSKDFKGKTKKDRRSGEHFTDNAIIPSIGGNNSIDVYTKIEKSGDNVLFTSWYDLGGAYLNSYEHGDEAAEAQKILLAFALDVAKEMTLIEIDNEEKKLKDLNNALKKLEKEKENYEKEIEQAKERIAKAEADIEQNGKDQENAKLLIEDQEKVLDKVKEKLSDLN